MHSERYSTPGVYFEWRDAPKPWHGRRTDIAGFVGFAPCGPLHRAQRVTSWTQFETIYGGLSAFFLGYAVRGFFENGGVECFVVRVADEQRARKGLRVFVDRRGEALFALEAISEGVWPHAPQPMQVVLAPTNAGRFRLTLRLSERRAEVWHRLGWESAEERRRMRETLNHVEMGSTLVRMLVGEELARAGAAEVELTPLAQGRSLRTTLSGGADGLSSVTLAHLTGEGLAAVGRRGLAALEEVDAVSIVAMPDLCFRPPPDAPGSAVPRVLCDAEYDDLSLLRMRRRRWTVSSEEPPELPPVLADDLIVEGQRLLVAHCERQGDRMAVLDARPDDLLPEQVIAHRSEFDTTWAALYYPWLAVADAGQNLRSVPPSGHVAGIYARGDRAIGVHKPPANEALENVYDLRGPPLDDAWHGVLHEDQINVIRCVPGRGIRILGASTLSRADGRRYVNVRRLLLMIAEAIDESTNWSVFEANGPALWAHVERELRAFLERLRLEGMLDGATAAEAYAVRCDEKTMTADDISNGRLICEVELRPPWPAEYVVVRVGKTSDSAAFQELQDG